ncbi:MAG: OmcA/MtrC family decaheme c-type cytochrome [Acidobacteria bacterium]|nr:OmcA/MtrC family decaheme c-type cytochrome [Acidobacteriota bacterium]
MKLKYRNLAVGAFVLLFGLATLAALESDVVKQYSLWEKEAYLSEKQQAWIRPGLHIQVLDLQIPADTRKPVVIISMADDKNQPLDREGNLTPAAVSVSFILSRINPGASQYTPYTTRTQTSPITRVSAVQAGTDSGGRWRKLSDGVYEYTFGTALPENYPRNATHTLGLYATRDLTEFGLRREVENVIHNFVPDGSPVTTVRDVVRNEACNQCHDPLQAHGGARQDNRLCVLCHEPSTKDPDTGNTVDYPIMVHKIHMGAELPSVQAGKPYQIIGFNQTVFNFSEIEFPQDARNCTTCHQKGTQSAQYLTKVTRDACGSCHDNVNFATGEHHAGGRQTNDTRCASCHWPEGELEFDASVKGAHTIPNKSAQCPGVVFELVDVQNAKPGEKMTVSFRIKNKKGEVILPEQMTSLSLLWAGPTTDYARVLRESATRAAPSGDLFTYTLNEPLPASAKGTYVVGIEGYRNVTLNPGTTKEITNVRDVGMNQVKYVAVTDAQPVARRKVVETAKCNQCHETLAIHGTNRRNTEYCVLCHNPNADDQARRPADKLPAESIDQKRLIHRIHMGEELTRDFVVYGFGNVAHNFKEVRYPGDQRNCLKCHAAGTYTLPLTQEALPTVTFRDFFTPQPPATAACLGCHDSRDAAAHAILNTATFGEACAVCHGEGAYFSVTKMHAR